MYVVPVPVQPFASVALTVIGKVPLCVGVPERTPTEDSDMPVGSALAVVNVTVPLPPVCPKVWLKNVFTVPVVVPGFVTVIVGHVTTSE